MNWDEVEAYMHLENTLESNEVSEEKKRPVVRQTLQYFRYQDRT